MHLENPARPTRIANAADAALVKGMLKRGDPTHDVAAWFGVNSGRIAAVKKGYKEGAKFRDVPPAPEHSLPPPGPYPHPGETMAVIAALREELRVSAHERRQTNAKLDMLIRQFAELRRSIGAVDATAPKPTRRKPMAA
jgi:hypothetical protein